MADKSMPPSLTERIFQLLSLTGLCLLTFIAGAADIYFQWPGSQTLLESFKGAKSWQQQENKNAVSRPTPDENARVVRMNVTFTSPNVTWDKARAFNGYTLVSTNLSTQVLLLDMEGNVVHRWNAPFKKVWPSPNHIHKVRVVMWVEGIDLYPNGDLLVQYSGIGDTPYGYGLARLDKDSNVIWSMDENNHHTVNIDPESGNIYALSQHLEKNPQPGFEKIRYPVLVDEALILSPEGKVLNRISLFEAFNDTPFLHYATQRARKLWDRFHSNSIRPLSTAAAAKFPGLKAGDILMSMKNLDMLAVIDPDTRKVVRVYKGPWRGQHSAYFLENGHLLMFDNKGAAPGRNVSRALEYDPESQQVAWSFSGQETTFFSRSQGDVQRLPNGNTFIAVADKARMLEVTPGNDVVWTFSLGPNKVAAWPRIRHAKRYAQDYPKFLKQ